MCHVTGRNPINSIINNNNNKGEPKWKRRIQDKIVQIRKDLSYLEEILRKGTHLKVKQKIMDGLHRRHPLLKKGVPCNSEELKQRIRAKTA